MTSSPTSSDSSLEEEKFLKPEDVEECIPPKELEMMIEEKKVGTLDDFVTLRWYCMLVLLMAELTAFTATASSKVMVFAGELLFQSFDKLLLSKIAIIGCGFISLTFFSTSLISTPPPTCLYQ